MNNNVVQEAFNQIEGYHILMYRNTMEGWYEFEIGILQSWVYGENKEIGCEIISENDDGKRIKIFPKNNKVSIDDLINFVKIIIETNEKISEKEKEFSEEMKDFKKQFEDRTKNFYAQLDSLKENSFKNLNESFVKNLKLNSDKSNTKDSEIDDMSEQKTNETENKKKKRGRPPKN